MFRDQAGHTVSGATAEALALFELALRQLHCSTGNPLESAEAAIAVAPDFTIGHLLRAHLCLSGMQTAGIAPALQSVTAARRLARTERETQHVAAATAWAGGHLDLAVERFDEILLASPLDSLALHMGHLLDFYRGDMRSLRNRVALVLPAWSAALPHQEAVLRMLALGLEETAHDAAAEQAGRFRDFNPREPGALENFMAVHNWWHLVLHHLDREEHVEVPCSIGRHAQASLRQKVMISAG
jgi:hypothetical protein